MLLLVLKFFQNLFRRKRSVAKSNLVNGEIKNPIQNSKEEKSNEKSSRGDKIKVKVQNVLPSYGCNQIARLYYRNFYEFIIVNNREHLSLKKIYAFL